MLYMCVYETAVSVCKLNLMNFMSKPFNGVQRQRTYHVKHCVNCSTEMPIAHIAWCTANPVGFKPYIRRAVAKCTSLMYIIKLIVFFSLPSVCPSGSMSAFLFVGFPLNFFHASSLFSFHFINTISSSFGQHVQFERFTCNFMNGVVK